MHLRAHSAVHDAVQVTYRYLAGPWGACSATCAVAGQPLPSKSRSVACLLVAADGRTDPVAEERCLEASLTRPAETTACNALECGRTPCNVRLTPPLGAAPTPVPVCGDTLAILHARVGRLFCTLLDIASQLAVPLP